MSNFAIPRDVMYKYWYIQPQLVSMYLFLQLHSKGEGDRRICTFTKQEVALWTGVKSGINAQGDKYGYVYDDSGVRYQANPSKVGRPTTKTVLSAVEANEQPILTIGKDFNVSVSDQHEITVTWQSTRPYKFLYINGDEIENFEFRDKTNYLSVFLTAILTAAFHTTQYHGDKVERGHVITSNAKIQSCTGLSRQQVRTILTKLTEAKHIMVKSFTYKDKHLHKGFDMTVCDYDTFVATKTSENPNNSNNVVKDAIRGIVTIAKKENYVKVDNIGKLTNYIYKHYLQTIPGTSFASMNHEQQAQQLLDNWSIISRPWAKDNSNKVKAALLVNPHSGVNATKTTKSADSNTPNYDINSIDELLNNSTYDTTTTKNIKCERTQGIYRNECNFKKSPEDILTALGI